MHHFIVLAYKALSFLLFTFYLHASSYSYTNANKPTSTRNTSRNIKLKNLFIIKTKKTFFFVDVLNLHAL